MPRLDVALDDQLLVRALRDPAMLRTLSAGQYTRVIDAAGKARLLGWLVRQATSDLLPRDVPPWLRARLASSVALVGEYDRALRWEIDRLSRAFFETGVQWLLLKGAAYLAAGLPPGSGRRVADIDILVPERELARSEEILKSHGWDFPPIDKYDERYYRQWMHESPPMVHTERRSIVDLHHAILPRTSRLHPSSDRLLKHSIEVAPGISVLCPSHMVLHAAAHLFHDGEISGAIRDLVDLDALLRWFGREPGFWSDLGAEGRTLELSRPLYYAVRNSHRLLATPVPARVLDELAEDAPPAAVGWFMDALVERTLHGGTGRGAPLSAFALYVRSHWLRMPPLLLARHLLHKRFSSPRA
jgi:hypothetical protein